MSSNFRVYIGPSIVCKRPTKTKTTKVFVSECSNTECDLYGEEAYGKFCGLCGNNILRYESNQEIKIDSLHKIFYDGYTEIEEVFSEVPKVNGLTLIANEERHGDLFVDGNDFYFLWSDLKIDDSIQKMKNSFKHEIEILKGYFESVEVVFNIIGYNI